MKTKFTIPNYSISLNKTKNVFFFSYSYIRSGFLKQINGVVYNYGLETLIV